MARSVKAVRDWLAFLNSEDSVAVYGQGSGAALVHCEGSNFMQIGGEVREKRERYDRQPLQLAISKLRALVAEPEENAIGSVDTVRELEAILECLEDGELPSAAANAPVLGPLTDPHSFCLAGLLRSPAKRNFCRCSARSKACRSVGAGQGLSAVPSLRRAAGRST